MTKLLSFLVVVISNQLRRQTKAFIKQLALSSEFVPQNINPVKRLQNREPIKFNGPSQIIS